MTDWEVTIVTESNYIKKIRVDNCITREDAEFQANQFHQQMIEILYPESSFQSGTQDTTDTI